MDDQPQTDRNDLSTGAFRHVDGLAEHALSRIADNLPRNPAPVTQLPSEHLVELLHEAALDPDAATLKKQIADLLAKGVTVEQLCEIHIPEVARKLGARWCDDSLGFAGVTVGCARLVAELRHLETRFAPPEDFNAPQILLLVAQEVYHTLGATVMAGILRRAGYGVQLWTGADEQAVTQHLRNAEFDAVFISASMGESQESIRRLVATAKAADPNVLTVVGGTIIQTVGSAQDVKGLTHADHATNNPNEALKLCETLRQTTTTRPTTPEIPRGG